MRSAASGAIAVVLPWVLALTVPSAPAEPEGAPGTNTTWYVFASAGCDGCTWLKQEVIPDLRTRIGGVLPDILFANVDDLATYETLMAIESRLKTSGDVFPALLVGSNIYYGEKQISAWARAADESITNTVLDGRCAAILATKKFPDLFSVATVSRADPTTPPVPRGRAGTDGPGAYREARVLYFRTRGCGDCARAEKQARYLARRFPETRLVTVDTLTPTGRLVQVAVALQLDVPREDLLKTPAFASGAAYLYATHLNDTALMALAGGAPAVPFWRQWSERTALADAERALRQIAGEFTLASVTLAGLADGVNPCAFAVVLFLVSYLTLGRSGGARYALFYGLTFCAGVFFSYYLIGRGITAVLDALQGYRRLIRWIFGITGLVCVACAGLAAADVVAARRRGVGAMKFGMPEALKRLTRGLIRNRVGGPVVGLSAFGLGVVVSGIELVCTGQVYLPVLVFINSAVRSNKARMYLLLYNAAFILPLLLVVALAVRGFSSRGMAEWARRKAVPMRAAVGLTVLALGSVLLWLAFR